jgi:hypothetical protein
MLARMRAATAIGLLLILAVFAGYAQAGAGSPGQGFSVSAMMTELSIFLPEGPVGAPRGNGRQGPGRLSELRTLLQSHRDPKLFFGLEQVNALLPLLQALYQNPFPTPAAARKLQATVEGLLTPAQRSVLDKFRRERDALIAQARQQGGEAAGGPAQGPAQRGSSGQQLTPLQRRQGMIEALIGMLNQRKKELAQ